MSDATVAVAARDMAHRERECARQLAVICRGEGNHAEEVAWNHTAMAFQEVIQFIDDALAAVDAETSAETEEG
jgi:hypothetical protein